MFKATLTSKGQVTIPKGIREYLQLETGDTLVFSTMAEEKVLFYKEPELEICPVCIGEGQIEKHECFICCGEGRIPVHGSSIIHKLSHARKYGVKHKIMSANIFQRVTLESDTVPKTMMDRAQDYYQLKIIHETAPRNCNDEILNEALSLLKLEESKKKLMNLVNQIKSINKEGFL